MPRLGPRSRDPARPVPHPARPHRHVDRHRRRGRAHRRRRPRRLVPHADPHHRPRAPRAREALRAPWPFAHSRRAKSGRRSEGPLNAGFFLVTGFDGRFSQRRQPVERASVELNVLAVRFDRLLAQRVPRAPLHHQPLAKVLGQLEPRPRAPSSRTGKRRHPVEGSSVEIHAPYRRGGGFVSSGIQRSTACVRGTAARDRLGTRVRTARYKGWHT